MKQGIDIKCRIQLVKVDIGCFFFKEKKKKKTNSVRPAPSTERIKNFYVPTLCSKVSVGSEATFGWTRFFRLALLVGSDVDGFSVLLPSE